MRRLVHISKRKNIHINKKGNILRTSGLYHKNIPVKHVENETTNSPIYGKILGDKVDSDNVKVGEFGSGRLKHIPFIRKGGELEDIGETLKKISFKEKKARNNIQLKI